MFSLYFKSNKRKEKAERLAAVFLVLALTFLPLPRFVMAEETPEVIQEEILIEAPTEEVPIDLPVETPAPEQTTSEDTTIETGDAVAETEINNEVNVNIVETQPSPEASAGEAEVVPEEALVEEVIENPGDTLSLDVSVDNEAVVENESETKAETGENEALSEEASAEIATGDAFGSANVVSVVNLNLIESNGFLLLLNNFLESLGHIDLRPLASRETPSDPNPCDLPDCAAVTSLKLEAENKAGISNVVIVRSRTGANSAEGSSALINTGDAYAGANVVNIANTNIIDSNYLLFAFNNFGDWDSDLIFPNADFFSSLFSPFSTAGAQVSNTNLADVESEVEVLAETGENETEGEEAVIQSGDALAGSNVSNVVNSNLFNTSTFFVVFRIFGSWNGSVFNAPEGISWAETPSGLELFSTGGAGPADAEAMTGEGGNIDVKTNNTANITNNIKVFALTGENKATSSNGLASVGTGNAYAGANVLNVANTNVISSNWIVALINIFGDWDGNVSFGQPDIWVATQVEAPETLSPGSEAVFHTTVTNRGDASASNVLFNGSFDSQFISFKDKDYGEAYSLEVGNLSPGETKEFSYSAKVSGDLPYGDTLIDHTLEVSAYETDGNPADNSDIVSLLAYRLRSSGRRISYGVTQTTTYPSLQVSKTNSAAAPISAPSTVDYTIVVRNEGGSAFEGVLYDVLKDENGDIITKNSWELGEIFDNEEITVTYTAAFNSNTAPGVYINSAWVEAWGGDYLQNPALGTNADSDIATSLITVMGNEGEVLGESCGLFLDKFMRRGANNDPEQVKRLQAFLNKEMNANLPVTGFYGSLTFQAVRAFQEKYADEVLAPWSLGGSTGIVYQTTLRWINQLECPGLSLEVPPLTSWSNNPNVPPALMSINPSPTPDPVSPAKLDNDDANDIITDSAKNIKNTKKANLLASSTSEFLDFLKDIFR